MLEVSVAVARGSFSLRVDAVLEKGTAAVFGPSGAGKSTLLHAIAGLARSARGRIVLDGTVLLDTRKGINVPAHERRLGVVFQDGRLFPHLTVEGNLRFAERYVRPSERRLKAGDVADLLALGPLMSRSVRAISGGEAQRVALGRALLSSPRLLVLDEPLSSLDQGLKAQLLPFLRRVQAAAGIPMLYVSHDLGEVLQLADEVLVLEAGSVVARGPFLDLLAVPRALALFRGHGLMNVFRARVQAHREADGVTLLLPVQPHGEQAYHSCSPLAARISETRRVGEDVCLGLRPEDVALALGPVEGTSIQNQLSGVVQEIIEGPDRTLVVVNAGTPLMCDVTRHSVRDLDLRPGRAVWCLIKAQALAYLGECGAPRKAAQET